MTRALIFSLAAMIAFAACGKEPAAPAATEAQATPPQTGEQSVPAAEAERLDPLTELDQPVGSSDGETVEEAISATSPVAAAVAASTPPAAATGNLGRWIEGQHFAPLPVAQPINVSPGQIEVIEGFWYGCGACYALEERLEAWEKAKPAWITLRRVPVIWNEVAKEDARLYFTVEGLGLVGKLQLEVFRRIHRGGGPITQIKNGRVDTAATEKAARDFLASHGVSAEDFARHYRTFSTENKLRQAESASRRYRIDHTPMMFVQGKYFTDQEMAGGAEQMFQLINELAARERGAT
ncbi:MAG: thiol:disulfide interchange protein DsbA/DsbL [Gammaproteobacteria bacterium]